MSPDGDPQNADHGKGSYAAPSAKKAVQFVTTGYLQQRQRNSHSCFSSPHEYAYFGSENVEFCQQTSWLGLFLNHWLINTQLASIFPCFISRYFAKVAALFDSGALGAKRKYMRWLFALFIAVSGWTGSVSGGMLSHTNSSPSGMALSALSAAYSDTLLVSATPSSVCALSSSLSLKNSAIHPQLRLMGVPAKKTAIKNRLGAAKFTGSANPSLVNNSWVGTNLVMLHGSRADEIYKQPRQSLPLVNYSNWIFHASTQRNRVGGWKESNIQYSGMLTYHHDDVMTFLLS